MIHPTQKPVSLFAYLIRTYTAEGALVLDCCMGSGTTAVAAAQTGRTFVGFEKVGEVARKSAPRIQAVCPTFVLVEPPTARESEPSSTAAMAPTGEGPA